MCCFSSVWCHGDRVECRVTGLGETACPGHTDPETGGSHIWYHLPTCPEEEGKCPPEVRFYVTSVLGTFLN